MSQEPKRPAFTKEERIGAAIILAQFVIAPLIYYGLYAAIAWIIQ
jgi:hypothetical protein